MKKFLVILAATSLLFASQAFAAGSATGGSTETVSSGESTVGSSNTEVDSSVSTHVEGTATDAIPPEQVITPSGETVAEVMAKEALKSETKVQLCNDLEVLKKRIECRLKKDADEIKYELEEVYMPEECRAMTDEAKKSACVERYSSLKPCWQKAVGPERIACVKEKLKIDKLELIDTYCKDKDDSCKKDYRWKVYNLITFRFYDAEERAEEWYNDGYLSLEDTSVFIEFIVNSKIEFYDKPSKADKVKVIKKVMLEWDALVVKVKAAKKA